METKSRPKFEPVFSTICVRFLSFLGCFVLPEGALLYGILLLPYNSRLLQLVSRLRANPEDLDRAKALFRWSILYMNRPSKQSFSSI